jgi:hypothetical protein
MLTKDEIDKLIKGAAFNEFELSNGSFIASFEDLRDLITDAIAAHTAKVLWDVEPVAFVSKRTLDEFAKQPGAYLSGTCYSKDAGNGHIPAYPAHTVAALAARVAELEKDAGDEFTQGIDAAVKMLDKMADDYSNAHAVQDTDTGVYEFGRGAKEDYYNTLRELADDIRSIVYAPGERENTAQTLKAAKDAAFEQAANLLECEYAEDAKQKRRLDQIAQHIRDLKKRSS